MSFPRFSLSSFVTLFSFQGTIFILIFNSNKFACSSLFLRRRRVHRYARLRKNAKCAWNCLNWWRWGESNSWPPACKAGALPAELHPHGAFFKAFSIVFSFSWKNVVGLTRLELVTSRLSGVRSNQLSYRPIFESYGSLKTEQYFEISDVRPTRS